MKRAQTALEYIFLVAGGLMFVTFVVIAIRGGVISEAADKLQRDVGSFMGFYARDYVFFDNFDTNTADRWTEYSGAWTPSNGQYSTAAAGLSMVGLTLSNFSYVVWLKIPNPADTAGVAFRGQSSTKYYSVVADQAENIELRDESGGVISSGSFATHGDASAGLTLTVNVTGQYVWVFVNDYAALTNSPLPVGYYDRGIFGLLATGQTTFDDVKVCKEAC